jgi:hypothetical protein
MNGKAGMNTMKRRLFVAVALGVVATPCAAWSCGGPAASSVAISTNGAGYTVTNIGRAPLQITFIAWGKTYSLALSPGQSGTPATGGLFDSPMKGYESCEAVVVQTR